MTNDIEQPVLLTSGEPLVPKVLTTSLEWLEELHERVTNDGVCRQDIIDLRDLFPILMGDEPQYPVVPALESYPIQGFTEDRSMLNQSVALEGVVMAMVATVQRILRTLMDAVKASANMLKKLARNEYVAGFKLKNLHNAGLKAAEGADQIQTKFIKDTSSIEAELVKYRSKILDDSPIRRTPYQLAALGDRTYQPKVEQTIRRIHKAAPELHVYLTEVRRILGSKSNANMDHLAYHPVFEELKKLRWEVEDLSDKASAPDYVSSQKHLMYFTGKPKPRARFPEAASKLVPYKQQLKMYEQLDKELSQIWKVNLVGSSEEMKPVLDGLRRASRSIENLQTVTEFLHRYNQSKKSALKVAYRFENKRFTLLYKAAATTTVTEPQRESLQQLKEKYTQILATLLS